MKHTKKMESKVCANCNTGKSFENFYNVGKEKKPCTIERSTRPYYENKHKISNQQKI